jgi:hypothetical protein
VRQGGDLENREKQAKVGEEAGWHVFGYRQDASLDTVDAGERIRWRETAARVWVERMLGLLAADENLAATHRSLWLGSRPRTGHREIFS